MRSSYRIFISCNLLGLKWTSDKTFWSLSSPPVLPRRLRRQLLEYQLQSQQKTFKIAESLSFRSTQKLRVLVTYTVITSYLHWWSVEFDDWFKLELNINCVTLVKSSRQKGFNLTLEQNISIHLWNVSNKYQFYCNPLKTLDTLLRPVLKLFYIYFSCLQCMRLFIKCK